MTLLCCVESVFWSLVLLALLFGGMIFSGSPISLEFVFCLGCYCFAIEIVPISILLRVYSHMFGGGGFGIILSVFLFLVVCQWDFFLYFRYNLFFYIFFIFGRALG